MLFLAAYTEYLTRSSSLSRALALSPTQEKQSASVRAATRVYPINLLFPFFLFFFIPLYLF